MLSLFYFAFRALFPLCSSILLYLYYIFLFCCSSCSSICFLFCLLFYHFFLFALLLSGFALCFPLHKKRFLLFYLLAIFVLFFGVPLRARGIQIFLQALFLPCFSFVIFVQGTLHK